MPMYSLELGIGISGKKIRGKFGKEDFVNDAEKDSFIIFIITVSLGIMNVQSAVLNVPGLILMQKHFMRWKTWLYCG